MRELILTFHGLGEPPPSVEPAEVPIWLDEARFAAVLDSVVACSASQNCPIRVTFDDGNLSDLSVALPALRARGLTARFFVCAGRIGQHGYLGAGDLRELVRAGMLIGSHGMDHIDWRRASNATLEREITEARFILSEKCGRPIDEVAVPFGAYDRRVIGRLRRNGTWRRVYTSDGGLARSDAWIKPRNSVKGHLFEIGKMLATDSPSRRIFRSLSRLYKRMR